MPPPLPGVDGLAGSEAVSRSGHRERQALAIVRRLRPLIEGARLARASLGDVRRKYVRVEVDASGRAEAWWRPAAEFGLSDPRSLAVVVWAHRPDWPPVRVSLRSGRRLLARCERCERPAVASFGRGLCPGCYPQARRLGVLHLYPLARSA